MYSKKSSGFTLIEVLTVVAIVAILATILVPTAGHMMEKARRTQAANNLRQVALAYASCQMDPALSINQTTNYKEFIQTISQKSGLTDPQIWIQKDDPRVSKRKEGIPRSLSSPLMENFPISITVAAYIPPNAPTSTTPIAWTRGLQEDGYWNTEIGVYGNKGGFIAFLDGHVQWYDNIATPHAQLVKANDETLTSNIKDAIGTHLIWEQAGKTHIQ